MTRVLSQENHRGAGNMVRPAIREQDEDKYSPMRSITRDGTDGGGFRGCWMPWTAHPRLHWKSCHWPRTQWHFSGIEAMFRQNSGSPGCTRKSENTWAYSCCTYLLFSSMVFPFVLSFCSLWITLKYECDCRASTCEEGNPGQRIS